ncbi:MULTISPECIES: DUF4430 domain-containing protein [Lacticaseibacillus]|uniref:DUF4430 domain-containing protein n=2 Tax=Lacticaseibacillus TaxID=2759736 RepID=A0ABZ0C052_LACCA|nr:MULTISPECIES: DUF4430 domain-containing protein [Lacticaseibacillus]KAB1971461.1 DUF4430 domain-containing protein [Lacticaseibacillus casei]WLV82293.1 DUF4430 domain-containing protein [Lacticaseibacillus sp. NCIMB 15473]WNX26209.1 DUF4430 domain-containing protein [Lacticaseibacillus casei]WNX28984.1 DUF4430 domain-containing protein [Lacticaseibacillus casei]
MKKALRSLVVFFAAMFVLAGCSNNSSSAAKSSSKPNQIVVTYQLKQNGKAFAKKKITQPKKSVVMTGLKKGWSVKASKGFITEIAGKKQNVAKKTYWLYTINGKMAKKGATTQPVKNHDKVVFDLSVTK